MTTDKRRQVVEDDLRALEEAHQLELEKKVELERTVDNYRQQLRSLSALHSAESRHKQVLQSEIQELRRLLQPNGVPQPASAAVEQAANAQAVAEARAQAAEAQMMALEEAMRISRAENERQIAEIQHLQTERRRAAAVRLAAQEERDALERSLQSAQQAAEAHLENGTLLRDKYAASRERMELVQEQLLGAQQQLAAQAAEAHTQAAGGVARQAQRVGDVADVAAERASRAEMHALLLAAEAKVRAQAEELDNLRATRPAQAGEEERRRKAAEHAVTPQLQHGLQAAEARAAQLQSQLDAARAAARDVATQLQLAHQELRGRAAREEQLLAKAEAARGAHVALEESAAATRTQLEAHRDVGSAVLESEKAELKQQLEVNGKILAGSQERESALLSELDLTKRAQAEAEHALARVQVALKQEQAQLLAAAQQAQHAAAEQEPLRQQVAQARATVDVFEGRLTESTAALGRKEAELAELKSQLLQLSQVEARERQEQLSQTQSRLVAAEAESAGWATRQQLLLTELETERAAARAAAAELSEARAQLTSAKQLLLASKDEQLADAHARLRAKEVELAEFGRRVGRLEAQAATQREELKMRSDQQGMLTERLRAAEEGGAMRDAALRERDSSLHAQREVAEGAPPTTPPYTPMAPPRIPTASPYRPLHLLRWPRARRGGSRSARRGSARYTRSSPPRASRSATPLLPGPKTLPRRPHPSPIHPPPHTHPTLALRRPRPAPPSPCERACHASQDAQLNDQLAQARTEAARAVEEGRQARQEADEVEARLASKEGRYDVLLEKVRVAREARGAQQQQLEARETAIVRLRGELTQAQGQLSEAVEGRVATEAASRASGDELQRVHAELKVLQLRVG